MASATSIRAERSAISVRSAEMLSRTGASPTRSAARTRVIPSLSIFGNGAGFGTHSDPENVFRLNPNIPPD